MREPAEVISAIEELGGSLSLCEDGTIRFRVPKHSPEAQALLKQLREDKPALVAHLKSEANQLSGSEPPGNPSDSGLRKSMQSSKRRFGQPHARLFPLIGQRVWTPQGVGKLLAVFAARCEVHPDRNEGTIRVRTDDVEPIQ
jgi:hypothetical protein